MKNFAKNMKKAFTITELVIVIAVIAILAAVLIPTFAGVISSAKESAAMQECRNALTVYTEQAQENEQPTSGVVFVNNNYAFVNLSGNLHLLGKLDDLVNINGGGSVGNFKKKPGAGLTLTETNYSEIWIQITDEKNIKQDAVQVELSNGEGKANELLYFYSVEVNGTSYVGYFTFEVVTSGKPAQYIVSENSTIYSRQCGYVAITENANMAVSATNPGTNSEMGG